MRGASAPKPIPKIPAPFATRPELVLAVGLLLIASTASLALPETPSGTAAREASWHDIDPDGPLLSEDEGSIHSLLRWHEPVPPEASQGSYRDYREKERSVLTDSWDARVLPATTQPAADGSCTTHPPIAITGDTGPRGFVVGDHPLTGAPIYRPGSGVSAGTGTESDPYLIAGWCIESALPLIPLDGISISQTTAHVVVTDNVITGMQDGIALHDTENVVILENSISVNRRSGVSLNGGLGNTIERNTFRGNLDSIVLDASRENEVTSNQIDRSDWDGIVLWRSADNRIEDNEIEHSFFGVWEVFSDGNHFEDNTFTDSLVGFVQEYGQSGTLMGSSFDGHLIDTVIYSSQNVGVYGNSLEFGFIVLGTGPDHYEHTFDDTNKVDGRPVVYLHGAQDDGTVVSSDAAQVILSQVDDVVVGGLELDAMIGLTAAFSDGLSVQETTFRNGEIGALLQETTGSRLENSTFADTFYGVLVEGGSGNQVSGGLFTDNFVAAVLWDTTRNIVHHNEVMDNFIGLASVFFSGSTTEANLILANNVTRNGYGFVFDFDSQIRANDNNVWGNSLGTSTSPSDASGDVTENWWGCDGGPGTSGCDSVSSGLTYDPYRSEPNPSAGRGGDNGTPDPPEPVEPEDPYQVNNTWEGYLSCSLRASAGANPCSFVDPAEDFLHQFSVDPDLKSLVVAMEWEPAALALDDRLVLLYEWGNNLVYSQAEGTSPLEMRVDDPVSPDFAQFRVFAGGDVNVVVDQPFTVHYHLFYHDYAPEGYSALPEQ